MIRQPIFDKQQQKQYVLLTFRKCRDKSKGSKTETIGVTIILLKDKSLVYIRTNTQSSIIVCNKIYPKAQTHNYVYRKENKVDMF